MRAPTELHIRVNPCAIEKKKQKKSVHAGHNEDVTDLWAKAEKEGRRVLVLNIGVAVVRVERFGQDVLVVQGQADGALCPGLVQRRGQAFHLLGALLKKKNST